MRKTRSAGRSTHPTPRVKKPDAWLTELYRPSRTLTAGSGDNELRARSTYDASCPYESESPKDLQHDREDLTRHLVFSAGPRVCPGAGISRIEQIVAWTRLLDRLESIAYAPDVEIKHQPGIMLGTLNLKLRIKKA